MHQLLLLRHAKATPATAGQDDRTRALSAEGRAAISTMRRVFDELSLAPDLILVSPSRRTLETLEGLEPWPETPLVEHVEELYLAEAATLLAVLRCVAETVRSVLLIAHNPGLHQLAQALHDRGPAPALAVQRVSEGFPTAGVAEFSVPGPWGQLAEGRARLVRFVRPKDARSFMG